MKQSLINLLMLICMVSLLSSCGDDDDDDNNDDNDDDNGQSFVVDINFVPSSVEEGGESELRVSLNQMNTTGEALTFTYTISGTATAGSDYGTLDGAVSIPDGSTSATDRVETTDDTDDEDDETIVVQLDVANLPEGVIGGASTQATLTITDNDASNPTVVENCPNDNSTDQDNFDCDQPTPGTSSYSESVTGDVRTIMGNGIPNHGYRNQIPMLVMDLNSTVQTYTVDATPTAASSVTSVTNEGSPVWVFGIALNGVKIDPAPAQPFIFENTQTGEYNFDWVFEPNNNMEAVGLDCAVAHVQPDGQYHYHGDMAIFADTQESGVGTGSTVPTSPVHIGWAADGFPIVYKYGPDAGGTFKELTPGYTVKAGDRPGDGVSEPCGEYNGKYTNDYEFTGAGDLDECNGISQSITIDMETFNYFYVITSDFPVISRCLTGTPDNSFKLGPP